MRKYSLTDFLEQLQVFTTKLVYLHQHRDKVVEADRESTQNAKVKLIQMFYQNSYPEDEILCRDKNT